MTPRTSSSATPGRRRRMTTRGPGVVVTAVSVPVTILVVITAPRELADAALIPSDRAALVPPDLTRPSTVAAAPPAAIPAMPDTAGGWRRLRIKADRPEAAAAVPPRVRYQPDGTARVSVPWALRRSSRPIVSPRPSLLIRASRRWRAAVPADDMIDRIRWAEIDALVTGYPRDGHPLRVKTRRV